MPKSSIKVDSSRYSALLEEASAIKGISLGRDAWRRLCRNRVAILSLGFLAMVLLLAVFTPLLPLQSPIHQELKTRYLLAPNLQPMRLNIGAYQKELDALRAQPDSQSDPESVSRQLAELERSNPFDRLWHKPGPIGRALLRLRLKLFGDWCIPSLCGTDSLGRDVLSRIFWGSRVALTVGIVAAFVSLVIGVSYGATAGYVGGMVDEIMMRIVDVLYSIPFIFVVIFLITFLSEPKIKAALEDMGINRIVILYIVIGAIYWLTMARVVRGQVISLKNEQFIEAARTIGSGRARIIFRHLVPNVMGIVIVYLTLTIPAVMLFEAFLSFLGMGVTPPDVSWGLLANEGIQVITPIKIYWWIVFFPGLALTLTLFALNFLGDGLRDALDPRMKNR